MEINFNNIRKIYFSGIGGISMSGLAKIILSRGINVEGSDLNVGQTTDDLIASGIVVHRGHSGDFIDKDIDLLVYTIAVGEDNPEIVRAKALGIPVMERASFLGRLIEDYSSVVAVSGTHGKTTVTSMLTYILTYAGKDPTVSVGAYLDLLKSNYRCGCNDFFLLEACEYHDSFLNFYPDIAVINNISLDHLDYFDGLADIYKSFEKFIANIREGGRLIISSDIENYKDLIRNFSGQVITFGKNGDYSYGDLSYKDGLNHFSIFKDSSLIARLRLGVLGRHNVINALCAFTTAMNLGINIDHIVEALEDFKGAARRLEYKGDFMGIKVYDDYAHHPEEITAGLEALENISHKKCFLVFQPHTYSRTYELFDKFVGVLKNVENLILTDIYAAREKDRGIISSQTLFDEIVVHQPNAQYFKSFDEIENFLLQHMEAGDLLVTMGAGNIYKIGENLLNY